MSTNISSRIRQILKHYELTAGEFAKKIGVQKSSISHLLSGRNKPSFSFLNKLTKVFPEINLRWLLLGEENMLNNDYQTKKTSNISVEKKHNDKKKLTINKEIKNHQSPSYNEKEKNIQEINSIIMIFDNDTFKILKKNNNN